MIHQFRNTLEQSLKSGKHVLECHLEQVLIQKSIALHQILLSRIVGFCYRLHYSGIDGMAPLGLCKSLQEVDTVIKSNNLSASDAESSYFSQLIHTTTQKITITQITCLIIISFLKQFWKVRCSIACFLFLLVREPIKDLKKRNVYVS